MYIDWGHHAVLLAIARVSCLSSCSVNMEVDGNVMNGESSRSNVSVVTTDNISTTPANISTTPKTEDAASRPSASKVLYGVEECPPWYICVFLGLQVSSLKYAKYITVLELRLPQ